MLKWFDGKKTYLVAGLLCVLVMLGQFGIAVPDWGWQLLAALGLGALRAGVKAAQDSIKEAGGQ
jgi:hypothetical protein